jgi:hypothetical protein
MLRGIPLFAFQSYLECLFSSGIRSSRRSHGSPDRLRIVHFYSQDIFFAVAR